MMGLGILKAKEALSELAKDLAEMEEGWLDSKFLNNQHQRKRTNMKNIFKFAGGAAVILALAQTLQAVPVTGAIGFTGRVTFDTQSAGTATEVVNWVNPVVNGTMGSFTSAANGSAVNFFAPYFFNTVVPINSFWSVGGFTFQLLSSVVTAQNTVPNGYVSVNGIGIVSGNGYTPTPLSWSFTSQDPSVTRNPTTFTFSASSASLGSVPDGGMTVALLGAGLFCVGLVRRKFAAV